MRIGAIGHRAISPPLAILLLFLGAVRTAGEQRHDMDTVDSQTMELTAQDMGQPPAPPDSVTNEFRFLQSERHLRSKLRRNPRVEANYRTSRVNANRQAPVIRVGEPRDFAAREKLPAPPLPRSSNDAAAAGSRQDRPQQMHLIQYDGVALAAAMRLFSDQTGHNVICSADAGQVPITAYLRDVAPLDALKAIAKANGLFLRTDEESGIVRISTVEEYEKDLTSFREEETRVFTLLYPNPVAVAQVIAQVFGNQVELSTADADFDDLADLSQRFNRFDLVDGRSLGLGTPELAQRTGLGQPRAGNQTPQDFSAGAFGSARMSGTNGFGGINRSIRPKAHDRIRASWFVGIGDPSVRRSDRHVGRHQRS